MCDTIFPFLKTILSRGGELSIFIAGDRENEEYRGLEKLCVVREEGREGWQRREEEGEEEVVVEKRGWEDDCWNLLTSSLSVKL